VGDRGGNTEIVAFIQRPDMATLGSVPTLRRTPTYLDNGFLAIIAMISFGWVIYKNRKIS
jgi:hypothetical protein